MSQHNVKCVEFTKMSGAGNDFVVLDNRNSLIARPSNFAMLICDRRRGIGADGLLLLEESAKADFAMKYFNSDGSYGGMCGNGGRCISRFAYVRRIVSGPEITFEALDHIYKASVMEEGVKLMMKRPTDFRIDQKLEVFNSPLHFHFVNSGSPHCVIFLDENKNLKSTLEEIDVVKIGREIRNHHSFYPNGTNVNFVTMNDLSLFSVRTYERGVEAETLACGTGSVAIALIANQVKRSISPITLHVRSGELLSVSFNRGNSGEYEDVSLSGSAHVLFNGTFKYDFSTQSILDIS
ncbi:MAG: diaminopimelate epimerase [Bacteroidota bacterium]